MADVRGIPLTVYYEIARAIALLTSAILFILQFFWWHGYWILLAVVALFFSITSWVIELLNDGYGVRSHISPAVKAAFYGAATFCLLPLIVIAPFLIPLGYLTASILYFMDYRTRVRAIV